MIRSAAFLTAEVEIEEFTERVAQSTKAKLAPVMTRLDTQEKRIGDLWSRMEDCKIDLDTILKAQKETLESLGKLPEELKTLLAKNTTGYRATILLGPTNN